MWNNAQWQPEGCSRSLKVNDLGKGRKPVCNFLLMNNTNLYPILHGFRVIETYWSNYCFCPGAHLFNSLVRGWLIKCELRNLASRTYRNIALSCDVQYMYIAIQWIVQAWIISVTDRQMDRIVIALACIWRRIISCLQVYNIFLNIEFRKVCNIWNHLEGDLMRSFVARFNVPRYHHLLHDREQRVRLPHCLHMTYFRC